MTYSHEVEHMCVVKKGPNHGPAPIPEEGKWVKAKEIVDISGLPPGIGRAILHAPVYMTLQPIRRTASRIATGPGELLPHLFTLTGRVRRLFSVTLLYPHGQLPVKKYGALCCPDFPHTRR